VGTPSFSPLEAGLTFHSHLSLRGDLRDIGDLVQIREVLETGLVRQVLALVGDADFDTLETAVAAMEREAAEGRYSPEADWLFHKTLYEPLRNELISDLLRVFWSVFDKVNAELPRTVETPQVAAAVHRNILDALRGDDPQVLAAAMADHFNDIRERISRVPRR
jgi:DNA-binding GntR family transcriptional regulator